MEIRLSSEARAGNKPFDVEVKRDPSNLIQTAVNRRDHGTCTECGFASAKYMRIRATRKDAVTPADYQTVCPFCWQVSHLDAAARQRSAELVWMPELTQQEINREMPGIYVERVRANTTHKETIKKLLDLFNERRVKAMETLGAETDTKLSDLFRDMPVGTPPALEGLSEHIRVWPLDRLILRVGQMEFNQFPQILAFWRSKAGPLAGGSAHSAVVLEDWLSRLTR